MKASHLFCVSPSGVFLRPGLLLLLRERAVTQAGGTHLYGHSSFQRREILAPIASFHLGATRPISARRASSSFNLSQIVLFYLRGEVTVLRGSDSHHAPSRDECTARRPSLAHHRAPALVIHRAWRTPHPSHPILSPSPSPANFPARNIPQSRTLFSPPLPQHVLPSHLSHSTTAPHLSRGHHLNTPRPLQPFPHVHSSTPRRPCTPPPLPLHHSTKKPFYAMLITPDTEGNKAVPG